MLPQLSVPRLTDIQLSGRSILLQHFKIRLFLTKCGRNSFLGNFTLNPNKKAKLKYCTVAEISVEENAISSERVLNDGFVVQFAALNNKLTTSDIDGWFHADEPGYEYLDEQGIVDLVSVAKGNECDEEEDADENTQHSKQKAQCSLSCEKAMQMFD